VAYLGSEVRARPNLKVQTGAIARRLLIENRRATGVVYTVTPSSETRRALARSEVIVCAGSIDSPKLLMLSCIGPADHLRSFDIPVILDLAGVGSNLQDHLIGYVAYAYKGIKSAPSADGGIEAALFTRSRPDLEWPDLQFHFIHKIYGRPPDPD